MISLYTKLIRIRDTFILFGFIRSNKKYKKNDFKLEINNKRYDVTFLFKSVYKIKLFKKRPCPYLVKIPIDDLMCANINNKIFFVYRTIECKYKKVKMKYKSSKINFNGRVNKILDLNTSIYLRKNENNSIFITVRKINKTDNRNEKIKIYIAYHISKIIDKNKIILYEKESRHYEESSSVLYEKFIDNGYKNTYYIIDKDCKDVKNINSKYRKYIIYKYSFKHYLYFFSANTFIGTELLGHAIELRAANNYILDRILDPKLNFIFLQHGVTYMVPLSARTRVAFRKISTNGLKRVVVSSKLEANHFICEGNYSNEDIYICGIPKFDKNKINENPDKIIIMLTWRPWEYNQSRINFIESRYYKILERIVESIPENLKSKIIVLPHPLLKEVIFTSNTNIEKYFNFEDRYNDLLKEAKVLITDYSSIAYDAFYRGSNVIFYWEEKDYCMKYYGENTEVMLNKENSFGDICYSMERLRTFVEYNYYQNQNDNHKNNYRKIVEFYDNKNTERLIEYLRKDQLI